MDWNAGRIRQTLRRIVALLFLFAALAERAGRSHHLVRRPVLWILRRAESIAREFVTGEAGDEFPVGESAQGDAGEATRLALSFRALALSLAVLIGQIRHLVRHRPEQKINEIPRILPGIAQRVLAPDTS